MIGKINDDLFKAAVEHHTGAKHPSVVIGPQMGVDAAILDVGGRYMAVAEDPIFPGPTTSPDDFGWVTIHIGASDVAVMGIKPQFMTYSLLLPPGTPEDYITELIQSISKYAKELGITIVGGHTGYYSAVTVPIIGGITVWGMGDDYVAPTGALPGDTIIITKGAAIEAAAILACELRERLLASGMDPQLVARACSRWREMTVVKDAEIAMSTAGIHAMHDATEGGLTRGLWEVAEASGTGLLINYSQVPVPPDVDAVCRHFDMDPYTAISEGTLIICCEPEKAEKLLDAYAEVGIEAAIIGKVLPRPAGRNWILNDGSTKPLVPPEVDPFWEVFFNALAVKEDKRTAAEAALCNELNDTITRLKEMNIAPMIPEVGANLAYAGPEAKDKSDIIAIPGRLLRFKNNVAMLGQPEPGCSRYMSSTLLTARKYFPETRCVLNLACRPGIEEICRELGLSIAVMPAPADFRQNDEEYETALTHLLKQQQFCPDVVLLPDRINLEKMILVFSKKLDNLIDKVNRITKKCSYNVIRKNNC
ncbi:thiamine-phosphate synthase family protein [Candidatus Contubernalis alkaliaceticus]|uniref:thiamine-phosphate synthase family protein n=1 Tax=Candidatus Contubernalis alkaliaceticus TaxID=338645 RepID=UPI001F4BE9FB|nr:thiamine-phosphate synthase family protein [Candidatus Contubernalis alkalaceticus]UNC91047.1 AIR synthase [Candidatus Contubernalis alkalaceticus]